MKMIYKCNICFQVTSLESRLQELSETVGTYDRLRAHDQQEIAKLKNRDGLVNLVNDFGANAIIQAVSINDNIIRD